MTKFKVGDTVQRVTGKEGGRVPLYTPLKVTGVGSNGDLALEGKHGTFIQTFFELVARPIHPYDEIIRAWLDGKTVQAHFGDRWTDCQTLEKRLSLGRGLIEFKTERKYRIKPETTENELRKEAILNEMDSLKAELEQLEVK